jgi:dTMP kinase
VSSRQPPGRLDRFERERSEFFERVRSAYLERAAREPARFVVIDANAPIDAVAAAVLAAVLSNA